MFRYRLSEAVQGRSGPRQGRSLAGKEVFEFPIRCGLRRVPLNTGPFGVDSLNLRIDIALPATGWHTDL